MTDALRFDATSNMTDAEMQDISPQDLFFAGSDEEGEAEMSGLQSENDATTSSPPPRSMPQSPVVSSPCSSPAQEPLFLEASDDEETPTSHLSVPPAGTAVPVKRAASDSDSDFEIIETAGPSRTKPVKKENDEHSSLPVASSSTSLGGIPASKKPRLGTPPDVSHISMPAYIGEIIVPNAWSTLSGRGYISPGDPITLKRDTDSDAFPSKLQKSQGPSKAKKSSDGKKQLQLSFKTATPKALPKKKKGDTIVRLANKQGIGKGIFLVLSGSDISVEFGRLPVEFSWWVYRLLELSEYHHSICLIVC